MERIKSYSIAQDWADGYPIGNGRLGAIVVSKGGSERLSLNHDLLWRNFVKHSRTHTKDDIEELKALCREKKYIEAENLLAKTQPLTAQSIYINPFVPAGDLYITTGHAPENHVRSLIMDEACATTQYTCHGIDFARKSFASAADGVILTRLTCTRGSGLDCKISLSRIEDLECDIVANQTYNSLELIGTFEEGHSFCVTTKLYNRGGKLMRTRKDYIQPPSATQRVDSTYYVFSKEDMYSPDYGIEITCAKADELLLATFISVDEEAAVHGLNAITLNEKKIREFEAKYQSPQDMWDEMYIAHVSAFQKVYGETKINLYEGDDRPTEELLAECDEKDHVPGELAQKLFSMARYLSVTSGMPQPEGEYPKAPINLQGMWCRDLYPAWDCDYHSDLNVVMCYWPMATLGLSHCVQPLVQWLERLLPQARIHADDYYGCSGIAFQGCCDYKTIGKTDNVGFFWIGAAAWYADVLWEHFTYTRDMNFLADHLLPFMREISDFYADMLEEIDGFLMAPFGASPEFWVKREVQNTFVHSAATIDLELAYSLFMHLAEAEKLLGCDERSKRNAEILKKLPLPTFRDDGCISEFYDTDYEELDPGHRHRSPLVSLCPGSRISYRETPQYAEGAYKLIMHRISHGKASSQAWSYAWDAQLLARLGKSEDAYARLLDYCKYHVLGGLLSNANDWCQKHGGLAWFAGYKIFQIEACLSMGAGIMEMLFQSRQEVLEFLPALPKEFSSGSVTKAPAKNGFEVSFSWKDGIVQEISIFSRLGGSCRILLPEGFDTSKLPKDAVIQNGIASLQTAINQQITM